MRRVIHGKRLAVVAAVGVAVAGGLAAAHAAQVRRQASSLKDRAVQRAADPAKLGEAVGLLEQYAKFRPDDAEAARLVAGWSLDRAATDPKQGPPGADAAERFLRRHPDHPDERRRLVDLYLKLGRYATARQHVRMLLDTSREDPELLDRAATCELGLGGDVRPAAELLDQAVRTGKAPARTADRLLSLIRSHKLADPRFAADQYVTLLRQGPYAGSVEAQVVAGRFLLRTGDQDGARAAIAAALKLPGGADHPDARLAMAELELAGITGPETAKAQLAKAEAQLAPAFAADPKNARVALLLSRVRLEAGKPADAVATLRAAADAAGEGSDEFVLVIDRLFDLGDRDQSAALTARLADKQADAPILPYLRGRAAVLAGDWPRAKGLLEPAVAALGPVPEFRKKALAGLGRCYEALQNPDKQHASFAAALKDDPAYLPALVGEADALFRLGRFREALPRYKTLVGGYGLTAYRPRLARLEFRAAMTTPAAGRSWQAFDEALGPPAERTHELRVLAAEGLAAQGERMQAAAELEVVLRADPAAPGGWLALARVSAAGNPGAALKVLDEAERKTGDSVDLRLARAVVLLGRSAKPDDFRKLTSGAEKFPPADRHRLLVGLGDLAGRVAGLRAFAIESLQQAAALNPADLAGQALLLDLAVAANKPDVIAQALAGIAAAEGPNGPLGSLGRVVVRLPEAKALADPAARAAALRELREAAEKVRAERPAWPRADVALARIAEAEGRTDAALKHFQEAIAHGDRQEAVIRRAVELLRDRRQDDAAAALLNTLAGEVPLPDDLERFRAVRDLLARDLPANGRATVDRVAPAGSTDWRVLLLRGSLLATLGEDADAGAAFAAAVEKGGDSVPEPWVALVGNLVRVGKLDDARRAVAEAERRLKADPMTPAVLVALAGCHELVGDGQAEDRYRQAAAAARDELDPARQLVLFLQRSGKGPEAAGLLRQWADAPAPELARWARRHLALTLAAEPDAYAVRGDALRLVEQNLAGGQAPDPEDVKAKAVVQTIDPASREEAVKALKEFAKWGDLSPDEYLLLGRLRLDAGQPLEAAEWFEKAARPRPGVTPEHLAALVGVCLSLDRLEKAAEAAARLAALAPRGWEAAREEARVWCRKAAKSLDATEAKTLTEQARQRVLSFPDKSPAFVTARSGPLLEELGFHADAEAAYRTLADYAPLAAFLVSQNRPAEAVALARQHEAKAGPVATARTLVAAARLPSAATDLRREVFAWLDRVLAASGGKDEHGPLLAAKAELLEAAGEYDAALAAYEEAVRRANPDDADLLTNNRAMLLALHRPAEAARAVKLMDEVIARRGPAAAFLDTRAVARIAAGQTAEAVADLNLALAQRRRPAYLFHLAQALDRSADRRSLRAAPLAEARKLGLAADDLHPLEARAFAEMVGRE